MLYFIRNSRALPILMLICLIGMFTMFIVSCDNAIIDPDPKPDPEPDPDPGLNNAPTAEFGTTIAYVGKSVRFVNTSKDPDGDRLTYSWDFGDQGRSSSRSPSHVFNSVKTYNVTLKVTDEHGANATKTRSVRVHKSLITERWPSYSDGSPSSRNSPMKKISHQKNDERYGWQWTQVENTNDWHWQHDVKIEDDNLSYKIHANTDNHRLQVGEPAIFKTNNGYRLEMYIKHDRIGSNPIIKYKVYIEKGKIYKIKAFNIRGAGALEYLTVDNLIKGLQLGFGTFTDWNSGGIISTVGYLWKFLDSVLPADWLHQYRGWQLDGLWFAAQVGDLYAKELPVN